ncbi:MAG TPA: heme exporter protein CcmD [Rhodanobacter sp.]|nr:heme exporter protein CcmD [Rhodanobacter sp.]
MSSFFAMGGYATAVWPAYAAFIALLAADFLSTAIRHRRQLRELRARLIRRQTRHEGRA